MKEDLTGSTVVEIADLARSAAGPQELEPGRVYGFASPDGVQVVDLVHGAWAKTPERMKGTTVVDDVESFGWLVNRYEVDGAMEVYADRKACTVTAVFNSHAEEPGWRDHRAVLQLRTAPAWQEWFATSGRDVEQRPFAEFVEDHLADILEPSGAHMLEVAQKLQGTQRVEWRAAQVLADGTRQLTYAETTDAHAAGPSGNLKVPHEIKLALRVFEGVPTRYEVAGRFRYRINSGQLRLSVKLLGLDEIREAAFAAVVAEAGEKTGATILWGQP